MTQIIYTQIDAIRDVIKDNLPYGLETTADVMLETMSHSKDEKVRDMAAYIKTSKNLSEIKMLFDFGMSMLQHTPISLREQIYDKGIDGVLEFRNHFAEKDCKDGQAKKNEFATNVFNWLILKLPAKKELKSMGLIYS